MSRRAPANSSSSAVLRRPEPGAFSALRMATFTVLLACTLLAFAADGAWLKNVPARDHEKTNPYHGQEDAVEAGHRVFADHCAPCHGNDAQGTSAKRPSLRSERIQNDATEGDLRWIIFNGNLRKGMPSWSKLGDAQIWQVITYVKSLKVAGETKENSSTARTDNQ